MKNDKTKRILFIVWKWGIDYINFVEIINSEAAIVKCLKHNNDEKDELINTILSFNFEKAILLLHMGEPNNFKEVHKNYIDQKLKDKSVKTHLFKGGRGDKIYFDPNENDNHKNGLLDQLGDFYKERRYTVIDNNKIKKENFEFVWDWYWNKLDLEYQKKNLINLWLPLAIDMQGLRDFAEKEEIKNINEIGDKHRINEYFKAIKEDVKKYKYDNLIKWNELKGVLKEKNKEGIDLDLPDNLIEKVCSENSSIKEINDYIKADVSFLPEWMKKVIGIIDDKMKDKETR